VTREADELQADLSHVDTVAWLPSAAMTVDELLALAGEAALSMCLDMLLPAQTQMLYGLQMCRALHRQSDDLPDDAVQAS